MKTFIFEIPRLLSIKSKELDVTASLINRSWMIFNDEGVKQVFVFLDGGKVLVSTNGKVSYSQWNYFAVNQALVISSDLNKGLMFHPAFVDDKVIALQLDGTNEVLFMIDESAAPSFAPKTLSDLNAYFVQKETMKTLSPSKSRSVDIVEMEQPLDSFSEPSNIEPLQKTPLDLLELDEEMALESDSVNSESKSGIALSQVEWEIVQKECKKEKRGHYLLGSFLLIIALSFFIGAMSTDGIDALLIFAFIFLVVAIFLYIEGSKVNFEKSLQERLAKKTKH